MTDENAASRDAVRGLSAMIVAGDTFRLAAAEHYGLGLNDTHAISYLDAYGPMSQTTFAQMMGMTSGGATGMVDRLERAGIARRGPDPLDRRRYRVDLTPQSRALVEEAQVHLARAFDDLDAATIELFGQALHQLASGLTREAGNLRRHQRVDQG